MVLFEEIREYVCKKGRNRTTRGHNTLYIEFFAVIHYVYKFIYDVFESFFGDLTVLSLFNGYRTKNITNVIIHKYKVDVLRRLSIYRWANKFYWIFYGLGAFKIY